MLRVTPDETPERKGIFQLWRCSAAPALGCRAHRDEQVLLTPGFQKRCCLDFRIQPEDKRLLPGVADKSVYGSSIRDSWLGSYRAQLFRRKLGPLCGWRIRYSCPLCSGTISHPAGWKVSLCSVPVREGPFLQGQAISHTRTAGRSQHASLDTGDGKSGPRSFFWPWPDLVFLAWSWTPCARWKAWCDDQRERELEVSWSCISGGARESGVGFSERNRLSTRCTFWKGRLNLINLQGAELLGRRLQLSEKVEAGGSLSKGKGRGRGLEVSSE